MLEKKIEIEVNPYDANIRTITTTWSGFNNRGEFIYHSKMVTCYSAFKRLDFYYYVSALKSGIEKTIRW